MVQFGPTFWPVEEAAAVLSAYRDFIQKAPEDVSGFFAFLVIPPGAHVSRASAHEEGVRHRVVLHRHLPRKRKRRLKPMRSLGHPLLDHVGPAPFPAVQSMFDALFVPGLQWYWRADNFTELSDEAIARHVEHGSKTARPCFPPCIFIR